MRWLLFVIHVMLFGQLEVHPLDQTWMWCWPFADGRPAFGSGSGGGGLGAREKHHLWFGAEGLAALDTVGLHAVGLVVGVWRRVGDELLWVHKRDGSLAVALGQLSELARGLEPHDSASGGGFSSWCTSRVCRHRRGQPLGLR